MDNNFKNFGVVILAAGRGKRLGCVDMPKVLSLLNGRPIVSYVLEQLEKEEVLPRRICLVVGFKKERVKEALGDKYFYAVQEELLGTAHAAHCGEKELPQEVEDFLVLNGDDSAFYKYETLNEFVNEHKKKGNDITLLTCEKEDPQGLGRVIRKDGKVIAVREKENLQEGEDRIKEISTGTFCFKREWFKNIYPQLRPIPGLDEYGLPSFIEKALGSNARFSTVKLENPDEWFGINTLEQLEEANRRKTK